MTTKNQDFYAKPRTISEIANHLNIHPATLRRLLRHYGLYHPTNRGTHYYTPAQLHEIMLTIEPPQDTS